MVPADRGYPGVPPLHGVDVNLSDIADSYRPLHFNGHFPGEPGLAGVY